MSNNFNNETVFQNQWVTVENQTWDTLDHNYTVVRPRLGKAVAIIPIRFIHGVPEVLMVSQPRIPHGGFVWEFPAGGVDKNEEDLTSALRELKEETNIHVNSEEMISLGKHYLFPALVDEILHIYAVVLNENYPFDTIKPAEGEIFNIQWLAKIEAMQRCATDPSYDFSSLGKLVLAEQAGLFD